MSEAESEGSSHPTPPPTFSSLSSTLVTTKRPLVLHFDINETILIGDEAGGDTREDVINKMLAKSAFVQMPHNVSLDGIHDEQWIPQCWWNGLSIEEHYSSDDVPPPLYTGWEWPANSCPYYRTALKSKAKRFVMHHGSIYNSMYKLLQQRLFIDPEMDPHSPLAHLLPALFETLVELTKREIPHRLVFRTFGTDLADVATAMTAFAAGRHPRYPNFVNPEYSMDDKQIYHGTWVFCEESQDYSYQLSQKGQVCALGDSQVLKVLEQYAVCGIRDDYDFWNAQHCAPWAGKPVWNVDEAHHILLDDNIHNLAWDSIACVRVRTGNPAKYTTLSSSEALKLHGTHLIRVPTIEPVLNSQWFLTQIDRAVEKSSDAGHFVEMMSEPP